MLKSTIEFRGHDTNIHILIKTVLGIGIVSNDLQNQIWTGDVAEGGKHKTSYHRRALDFHDIFREHSG